MDLPDISTANWTTCEEFLNGTRFEVDSVIDVDWVIFYYWTTHAETSYHIRFSAPTPMVSIFFICTYLLTYLLRCHDILDLSSSFFMSVDCLGGAAGSGSHSALVVSGSIPGLTKSLYLSLFVEKFSESARRLNVGDHRKHIQTLVLRLIPSWY